MKALKGTWRLFEYDDFDVLVSKGYHDKQNPEVIEGFALAADIRLKECRGEDELGEGLVNWLVLDTEEERDLKMKEIKSEEIYRLGLQMIADFSDSGCPDSDS